MLINSVLIKIFNNLHIAVFIFIIQLAFQFLLIFLPSKLILKILGEKNVILDSKK